MKTPTYGDAVRVKCCAPRRYNPGAVGTIVSMFESPSKAFEEKTGVPIGEMALGVEFTNGATLEIPFVWLELLEKAPD